MSQFDEAELAWLLSDDGHQAIWRDVELRCIRPTVSACSDCGSFAHRVDRAHGDLICYDCGLVRQDFVYYDNVPVLGTYLQRNSYKEIHHFHERIKQFLLLESRIPDDHFACIREALDPYDIPKLLHFDKSFVQQLLRSVSIQQQNPVFSKKYLEKWLQIIYRLTGNRPPFLTPNEVHLLDVYFTAQQLAWQAIRPTARKNSLNYNARLQYLMFMIGKPELAQYFPTLRTPGKRKQTMFWLRRIEGYNQWEPVDFTLYYV